MTESHTDICPKCGSEMFEMHADEVIVGDAIASYGQMECDNCYCRYHGRVTYIESESSKAVAVLRAMANRGDTMP